MIELRRKIDNQLNQLTPERLVLVSSFLDSILITDKNNSFPLRKLPPLKRGKKAKDLLENRIKWQGNDLEECLQFVRETRSETQF